MKLLSWLFNKSKFDEPGLATCVSYPKSGRTWLRVMLDEAGVPLLYTHGGSAFHNQFRDPGYFLRKGKVLFLSRDPVDTAVSGYFHVTKREPWRNLFHGSVSEFVVSPLGVERTATFNKIWSDAASEHPNALLTTYEALHEEAPQEIDRIARWLGVRLGEEDIEVAVSMGRFETMQAKESSGEFSQNYDDKLLPGDAADRESYKVRKGKVGGARDYLSPVDLERCEEIVARVTGA